MVKEINGYKVRVSQKEGMRYVKVLKENKLSQEFIGKETSEKEIESIARRMIEEVDKVKPISEEEIIERIRAERGHYQVLEEDKGIKCDKKVFYKHAIKENRLLRKEHKQTFSVLCPKELRKEINEELDIEEIAKSEK